MGNEVQALGRRVDSLMQDVGQAQMELEQSREHLIQAEKTGHGGQVVCGRGP